ncbi:MAG: HEAT repeat domain-containing protein [Acidimicrobiales bacterium]|nr:HEAT repeat domain-containing protein [Acidimicrobiales bacterium]
MKVEGQSQPAQRTLAEHIVRRRSAALAGHEGDVTTALALLRDEDPSVRATALGALIRLRALGTDEASLAASDTSASVRRRLAEEIGRMAPTDDHLVMVVVELLDDEDDAVVESAAWAAGECFGSTGQDPYRISAAGHMAVRKLMTMVKAHRDPLVREAAVAALGAIGAPEALPEIRAGLRDKPAIRRRAVLALSAFDPEEIDNDLRTALADRDWQVREAARDLLDEL